LGGEGLPSKCAGVGVEERSKGAAREIAANQQDRRNDLEVCKAWLFAVSYYSSGWPLSHDESSRFYLIKSTRYWFSLRVFPVVIYPKISCAMCMVSLFMLLM
jgi:hypothetical protein